MILSGSYSPYDTVKSTKGMHSAVFVVVAISFKQFADKFGDDGLKSAKPNHTNVFIHLGVSTRFHSQRTVNEHKLLVCPF